MNKHHLFGIENHVYHANGKVRWFASRAARAKVLARMRAEAVERGLAESSALYGIVPVVCRNPSRDLRERVAEVAGEQDDRFNFVEV